MKLFQQMLLAPAALGLLAPMAATASELNIDGVNRYADSQEQVTSITQFSDVQPTEWAYQALSNLVERYGCVAGYPDGTFRGKRPLSRWEAAALLNACLDRITEVTDELRRLMKEFEVELSVLKGRVDGLEAKVGELEANQFSTTTKLSGQATFIIGANTFGGDQRVFGNDTGLSPVINPRFKNLSARQNGATAFNYDLRIDLNTSFTGKDLLRTRLRAGNFGNSPFGGQTNIGTAEDPVFVGGLNATEVGFEEASGANSVGIDRLFYQFPLSSSFTATVGARVRQDDMLAVWPSVYPADTVLDIFTYAGAPGAYSLNLGSGAGLWWTSGNFSVSANYVAANGNFGNVNSGTTLSGDTDCDNAGGIGNECSAQTGTAQIAYAGDNFGIAAAYTYSSGGAGLYSGNGTPFAVSAFDSGDNTNSVGISAYWQPSNSGWLPSISTGWGLNSTNDGGDFDFVDGVVSQSWYVGLQWTDVFIKGNAAGMAVGQATFVTDTGDNDFDANDSNYAWEFWYKFQVTDNISVTPALYYLSQPLGQIQRVNTNEGYNNFGGFLKTTFKF
ncbi:iron uptake porin [Synechococcus sp. CS-603]|uniref:iron uptake porin n=1 Tax=Synechococcus sp. CS-603 TaxID=2847981 RepID=UPI0021E1FCAD|nr:iron uptake porin [Synechococcus sp. CS-603]MCT0201634.1 iron uptake porin [Synechococcus sp. CS-603]